MRRGTGLALALLGAACLGPPAHRAGEPVVGAAAADRSDGLERALAAARARAEALGRRGAPYSAEDGRGLLELALVDPDRFGADGAFRTRVLEILPRALPEGTPPELRDRVLYELAAGPGLTFEQSEALELAWGAARRSSAARETALAPGALAFPDELRDPISASLFSFPSGVVEPSEAAALLAAVREAAPERELVVLADLPLRGALEVGGSTRGVHWIETHGRPYSPWPRDPFSTARLPGGGLVLVERPDFQGGREGDRWLAREVVQNLPEELDRAWGGDGGVRWGAAPFPFHNGHVLMAGGAAWTSLHGLERRILAMTALERVPVESFGTVAGIDRYLAAARRVMDEMSA
ncbi:MAG TPA: hypothetical protein VMR44_06465, partial [Thermoanaerobaculia bacterium]|nr:hypothetical protein [Thermoanaerobaculia bacterium]